MQNLNVDFQTSWPFGKEVKNYSKCKNFVKGEISNHDTKLVKRIDPRILTKISIIGQGVSTKSTNSSTKSCQTPISHSKRLRRPSPKNVNLSDQNQGISFLNGNNLSGDPEVLLHSTTYELIIPMM